MLVRVVSAGEGRECKIPVTARKDLWCKPDKLGLCICLSGYTDYLDKPRCRLFRGKWEQVEDGGFSLFLLEQSRPHMDCAAVKHSIS